MTFLIELDVYFWGRVLDDPTQQFCMPFDRVTLSMCRFELEHVISMLINTSSWKKLDCHFGGQRVTEENNNGSKENW